MKHNKKQDQVYFQFSSFFFLCFISHGLFFSGKVFHTMRSSGPQQLYLPVYLPRECENYLAALVRQERLPPFFYCPLELIVYSYQLFEQSNVICVVYILLFVILSIDKTFPFIKPLNRILHVFASGSHLSFSHPHFFKFSLLYWLT